MTDEQVEEMLMKSMMVNDLLLSELAAKEAQEQEYGEGGASMSQSGPTSLSGS